MVDLGVSFLLTYDMVYIIKKTRGNNSAVECNLAKVEVAGSNPVSRSKNINAAG